MDWSDRELTLSPQQLQVVRWCGRHGHWPMKAAASGLCSERSITRWGGERVVRGWVEEYLVEHPSARMAAREAREALTAMVPAAIDTLRSSLAGDELAHARVRLAQWLISDLFAHAKELEADADQQEQSADIAELAEAIRLAQ